LAVIVPFLPFLQVRYAVEGRVSAMFSRRAIRDRFRRAPWAFAFSLFVLLAAAIPLYFLKLEMIPREAAWLPSLVFVIFLAPARLLTGWAYACSGRRDSPRHWIFRVLGRVAITAAALLYVAVVFGAQYTSWGGAGSLYEQHAFLLPVPFLNM
jgi:cytochrome bd-type quinol oxidase subunit 1